MVNGMVTRVSIRRCAREGFCPAGGGATLGAERVIRAHSHVCMVESLRLFPSARSSGAREQWLCSLSKSCDS